MRLVFIGASGHGRSCAKIAELNRDYSEILFLGVDRGLEECGGHIVVGAEVGFEKYVDEDTVLFIWGSVTIESNTWIGEEHLLIHDLKVPSTYIVVPVQPQSEVDFLERVLRSVDRKDWHHRRTA